MNYSNPYHDWFQSINQIGFKHLEHLSVFYSKAFEWQTHFYKTQLKAGERLGELMHEAKSKGTALNWHEVYHGYHGFHQKELLALYQSHPYKQTSQELKEVLPVVKQLHKVHLENLMFPLPIKMLLYFKQPYFISTINENSLSSEPKIKVNPVKKQDLTKSQVPVKKKRKE